MWGLEDRHVLITGAAGGIGRALVEAFRMAGARLTACDRDAGALDAVDGLTETEKLVFELTERGACAEAIDSATARQGPIDVLIANAGLARAETFADLDGEAWDREIAINLTGAYNIAAPVLEKMRGRGGALVFISSVNAVQHFGNPAYAAAKAGMLAFARAIAVEEGGHGIRANCVLPGSVRTPAWDHRLAADPALLDRVVPNYPLGRLVTPGEVANTALFLASPRASGITGAALPVDAGLTAGHLRFIRDVMG